MKVVDSSKEYFNSANKIVFWITVISIVWTIGYMFFWIDMNPLFINADKIANIMYTISTSIVASGIFYLLTIYIPNHFKIKKMILHLTNILTYLDYLIDYLLKDVYNTNDNKNYNKEDFINLMKTDKNRVEQDFVTYLSKSKDSYYKTQELINLYISIFNVIIDSHSNLLSKEIYIKIIELCRSSNQVNKVFNCYKPEAMPEYIILDIDNILTIRNMIKTYYKIK